MNSIIIEKKSNRDLLKRSYVILKFLPQQKNGEHEEESKYRASSITAARRHSAGFIEGTLRYDLWRCNENITVPMPRSSSGSLLAHQPDT